MFARATSSASARNRRPRILVGMSGITIVLTCVVISKPAPAFTTEAVSQEQCMRARPYGVDARSPPAGRLVEEVLPLKVGRFVRETLKPGIKVPSDEDANVTYRSPAGDVFVGVSRPGSPKDLVEAVRTSRADAVSDRRISLAGEIYCPFPGRPYHKLSKFMAWANGSTFFYADGTSKAALDEFMKAFPY